MMNRSTDRIFPAIKHNHAPCLADAMQRAERLFEAHGLKFTQRRRRVFQEIASSHHAIGAYDVLERLSRHGERLAPISVYRAIDALLATGAVHRLESRSAYFACHAVHAQGGHQLVLACEACGRVAEVADDRIFAALARRMRQAAFEPRRTVVEVTGTCPECQEQ